MEGVSVCVYTHNRRGTCVKSGDVAKPRQRAASTHQ